MSVKTNKTNKDIQIKLKSFVQSGMKNIESFEKIQKLIHINNFRDLTLLFNSHQNYHCRQSYLRRFCRRRSFRPYMNHRRNNQYLRRRRYHHHRHPYPHQNHQSGQHHYRCNYDIRNGFYHLSLIHI